MADSLTDCQKTLGASTSLSPRGLSGLALCYKPGPLKIVCCVLLIATTAWTAVSRQQNSRGHGDIAARGPEDEAQNSVSISFNSLEFDT
jgi:hypothetical protein